MEPTVKAMSAIWSAITTTLSNALTAISSVYTWAVSEDLILVFIALGLAGVMIRWARVLVNFIRG